MPRQPKLRPMLAAQYEPIRVEGQLPVYVQPKLDGIRMIVRDGVGLSRSMKRIPNDFIQHYVKSANGKLDGFDGELIVGSPTAPNVYQRTHSAVMTKSGTPNFQYYAFDLWDQDDTAYFDRWKILCSWNAEIGSDFPWVILLSTRIALSLDEIQENEERYIEEGYEGLILRRRDSNYKYGRATPAQGQLVKVKRFTDAEADVVGFEEKMHNANEAQTNELGLTSRSSHKANKVPMDTLGALVCIGMYPDGTPYDVKIGTGFDEATRKEIWTHRSKYLGNRVKFKYFDVGKKDNPRHPVFLGWRSTEDM